MSCFGCLVLNHGLLREHLSSAPIDFEEKPILMKSLNELDIIVCDSLIVTDRTTMRTHSRSFYSCVPNKIHARLTTSPFCIPTYSTHRLTCTHRSRKRGGSPPTNQRTDRSFSTRFVIHLCSSPSLVRGPSLKIILPLFVWTTIARITTHPN